MRSLESHVPSVHVTSGFACPEPRDLGEWTLISQDAWALAEGGLVNTLHVKSFYYPPGRQETISVPDHLERLYMIYTSSSMTKAYVGTVYSRHKLYKIVDAFGIQLYFDEGI